jgi:molybdenum cofactor synthesis domain-containing protein
MIRFKIRSLNISEKKGTVKHPAESVEITETGVKGDAHAGHWHRQVSLLGAESIRKAEEQNCRSFACGDFGENITTEGIDLYKTNILDRFQSGEVILEVTQIGKKCHKGCEIMKISENCIMPVEGIFCRVICPGKLSVSDSFTYQPRMIRIAVITLSDRAYHGVYEDKSGPMVIRLLGEFFSGQGRPVQFDSRIIPDDVRQLESAVRKYAEEKHDFIVTTGGTGIGSRDITTDVVKKLIDKEIPGIMELIRYKYGSVHPNALLSRGVAGLIGKSLIYTLPGSVKAVSEYLAEITPTMEHSLRMVNDIDFH